MTTDTSIEKRQAAEMIEDTLGEELRAMRERSGLSVAELGEQGGLSVDEVTSIESGVVDIPLAGIVRYLCVVGDASGG